MENTLQASAVHTDGRTYSARQGSRSEGPPSAGGNSTTSDPGTWPNERRENLYAVYREQLEHEDRLVGMRNGWLIGGQAFLFAAYATALSAVHQDQEAQALFHLLPVVGLLLAAFSCAAVNAALWRSNKLCDDYEKLGRLPEHFPPMRRSSIVLWKKWRENWTPKLIGHSVARTIAFVFIGAWLYVIVFR